MGGGEPSPDLEEMNSAASSSSSAPWDRLIEVGCIIYYRHRAYSGLLARTECRVIQVNLDDKKHPITLENGYDLATYDKIHITTDAYGNRYADPIAMMPLSRFFLRHGDRIPGAKTYFESIGGIARTDRKDMQAAAWAMVNGMSEEEAMAKYPGAAPYEPPEYTPSKDAPLRIGTIDTELHYTPL